MEGKIYCIQNDVNGKTYIGQTTCPTNRRKREHFWQLRKDNHPNQYLQNSFNKYSENNFSWIVLEENIRKMRELNSSEKFYVDTLMSMSTQSGYNIETPGNNKKHSIESRKKFTKVVYQYNIEGDFINSWPSVLSAANKLEINRNSISKCCTGDRKTSGGYRWRYTKVDKLSPLEYEYNSGENHPSSKKVRHIPTNKVFSSMTETAEYFDMSTSNISMHCSGEIKNSKFELVEDGK